MSSVTSNIGEKQRCQLCGYQTLKKAILKLHEQTVHDGKQIQHQESEYQATQESQLVSYQKSVHIGQKFQCSECVHQATTKSHLTRGIYILLKNVLYDTCAVIFHFLFSVSIKKMFMGSSDFSKETSPLLHISLAHCCNKGYSYCPLAIFYCHKKKLVFSIIH